MGKCQLIDFSIQCIPGQRKSKDLQPIFLFPHAVLDPVLVSVRVDRFFLERSVRNVGVPAKGVHEPAYKTKLATPNLNLWGPPHLLPPCPLHPPVPQTECVN